MNKITVGDEVYAILVLQKKAKKGTTWIGEPYEPLQGSIMKYEKGKVFRLHRHILNPRMIQRTQEAFVVISGKIEVVMHDKNFKPIGSLQASAGDAIFIYRGGHEVKIIKDAVLYEIKAGAYTYVSDDKEFKNDKS